jgi:hypothetical protein
MRDLAITHLGMRELFLKPGITCINGNDRAIRSCYGWRVTEPIPFFMENEDRTGQGQQQDKKTCQQPGKRMYME